MAKKRKNWVAEMFARQFTRFQLELLVDSFMRARFPDGTVKINKEYIKGFTESLNTYLLDLPYPKFNYEFGTPEAKSYMDGSTDAGRSIVALVNAANARDVVMIKEMEEAAIREESVRAKKGD